MFATAWSTLVGGGPPGGVAALNSFAQLLATATQLATALVSELKVAKVEVSVAFGTEASTTPTAPLFGSARLAAIWTALLMP
jgi:hypothetical protein